jgi:excisionase family DNA binding protein
VHPNRRPSADWLTIQEVAERFGLSHRTIRRWIHEGKLPASTVGGSSRTLRVAAIDADRLLAKVPAPGQ